MKCKTFVPKTNIVINWELGEYLCDIGNSTTFCQYKVDGIDQFGHTYIGIINIHKGAISISSHQIHSIKMVD